MEKIVIWYSIQNLEDAADLSWFLTKEEAGWDQATMCGTWRLTCIGHVETFVGSDIHKQAIENSLELIERKNSAE